MYYIPCHVYKSDNLNARKLRCRVELQVSYENKMLLNIYEYFTNSSLTLILELHQHLLFEFTSCLLT